jgi:transposase InsO family protein
MGSGIPDYALDLSGSYRTFALRILPRPSWIVQQLSCFPHGRFHDNAVAERFFSNLKNKLVHHCDFVTREQARSAIFDYIEIFYNRQRRHQTLGYVSPMQFEQMNRVS